MCVASEKDSGKGKKREGRTSVFGEIISGRFPTSEDETAEEAGKAGSAYSGGRLGTARMEEKEGALLRARGRATLRRAHSFLLLCDRFEKRRSGGSAMATVVKATATETAFDGCSGAAVSNQTQRRRKSERTCFTLARPARSAVFTGGDGRAAKRTAVPLLPPTPPPPFLGGKAQVARCMCMPKGRQAGEFAEQWECTQRSRSSEG